MQSTRDKLEALKAELLDRCSKDELCREPCKREPKYGRCTVRERYIHPSKTNRVYAYLNIKSKDDLHLEMLQKVQHALALQKGDERGSCLLSQERISSGECNPDKLGEECCPTGCDLLRSSSTGHYFCRMRK